MRLFGQLLVVFISLDDVTSRGFYRIPGQYCAVRTPSCCESRDDDCTAPILGNHLCYCDMFCDRGPDGGNDCCPDFEAVCHHRKRSDYQGDLSGQECISEGTRYRDGESVERNCQSCSCLNGLWKCDTSTCLIQEDLLDEVKNGRFSWTARNYSFFWGRSLDEVSKHFDVRDKWPNFIHEVRDQGDCGSSWAVSTTTISSDRLSIISDGRVNATISPQQLLSCNQHRQRGCEGGYLDRAWWYIRKLGGCQIRSRLTDKKSLHFTKIFMTTCGGGLGVRSMATQDRKEHPTRPMLEDIL
ncbi:hypothetical protein KIN20_006893 [Parelaphostrongylus tenuis]|uniref:SMB domain-containing protein n=1 Tax=Parelaphostrongylus tenuis TaxID=148309 RepID=A0AAD5ML41_PARTN|nr:hypothetical protein KIN20_006893 [Parelaphostrongylus tenuis]